MFRRIRILLLLGVLVITLGLTSLERFMVREWRAPLDVVVYPINGDGSEAAAGYIRALQAGDFSEINEFLLRETHRYGLQQRVAMTLRLQPELKAMPPAPPIDRNIFKTMAWSLKLRWWAYRHACQTWPQLGTIRIYVLYRQAEPGKALEHSLGLQNGLIGVVHAFADPKQAAQNNIVIAHDCCIPSAQPTNTMPKGGRFILLAMPSPNCRKTNDGVKPKSWQGVSLCPMAEV